MTSKAWKILGMIRETIESAHDRGAVMMVTPRPPYRASSENYRDKIIAKFGGNLEKPVVYYGKLISVAFGPSAEKSALDG